MFLAVVIVRSAAVAGSFYPGTPQALEEEVDDLLAEAIPREGRPKALVAPHAGYCYSGPIAASAYAQLRDPLPNRVVLIGPAHHEPILGLALPGAEALDTPLGRVPVDLAAVEELLKLSCVGSSRSAHALEHSLEVHLPFLQRVLPPFTIIPLLIGRASTEEVALVIDSLWGGEETLVIVSTDLSHYLPYRLAQATDAETAQAILEGRPEISSPCACGAPGLRGLLQVARRRRLTITQLDLRNSGDTSGDKSRVVGYGAFAFYEGT